MRRTFVMWPVGAVLSVLLAGCGGAADGGADGGGRASSPTTPTAQRTVTATTAPAPAEPTTASSAQTAPPAASCADTNDWGTGTKESAPYSRAPVYQARIGQHECNDRVVFDVNGPEPVGYHVGYVPVVTEDGSGREIPVEGGAALQVIIHAPTQGSSGDDSGHQPGVVFAPSGEYLHGPGGLEDWEALRAVRSAGSFEGQSTFAVGVRDRLPFTVTTWVDANQITHVIVDIAHR